MKEKDRRNWMGKLKVLTTVLITGLVLAASTVQAEAATQSQKKQARQEIINIYYSADTSYHDFSKYKLTESEFKEIRSELKSGEHERMVGSYNHGTNLAYYYRGNYVVGVQLETDDKDVLNRYKRVNKNADDILRGIEPEMDDLDKLIYLHDSIVELVAYNNIGNQAYTLGGALGDENAVCMGYAYALNLLLKEVGLETDYVRNPTLKHGWSYVKLNGEWYHVDPTWNDTRSTVKGQTSRQFLLRNEAEFMASGTNSHGTDLVHTGGTPISKSILYKNWFMHNVVGNMAFEDGLWYFIDPSTKDIVCADADGSNYKTVVKYSGQVLAVVDAEDDVLTYTMGGKSIEKSLSKIEVEDTVVKEEFMGNVNVDSFLQGSVNVESSLQGNINTNTTASTAGLLQETNLNDYSLWREGKYNRQSVIEANTGYFSTSNCYKVEAGGEYALTMKDTRFNLIVCEYTADNRLIVETVLLSGATHVMDVNTHHVGISTYMPTWKSLPWSDFVTKLKYELHKIEFVFRGKESAEVEEENKVETEDRFNENTDNAEVEESGYTAIENANLCDINLWREGRYNAKTTIEAYQGYFSTKECYEVQAGKTYALTMKDTRFQVVVYEYSNKGQLLAETVLASGAVHTMRTDTDYIGLSTYMPIWKDLPWSDFSTKLKYDLHTIVFTCINGGKVEVSEERVENVGTTKPVTKECEYDSVESADLCDFNLWKEGRYNAQATVEGYVGYFSTKECFQVQAGASYTLTMKDTRFRIVVYEYSESGQLIAQTVMESGQVHIMNASTCHIGLSMYMPIWKDLPWSDLVTKLKYDLHTVEFTNA